MARIWYVKTKVFFGDTSQFQNHRNNALTTDKLYFKSKKKSLFLSREATDITCANNSGQI